MKNENPDTYDFIIVGGGVHGLSTAYHLLEDGKRKNLSYKILLLEQYKIGNQWGSSHGPSRWYKNYYSNPLFKTLTQRCFEKYWPEMQKTLSTEFLHPSVFFNVDQTQSIEKQKPQGTLNEKIKPVYVNTTEIRQKYPLFPRFEGVKKALYQPDIAIISSEEYILKLKVYLEKHIKIVENTLVTNVEQIQEGVRVITDIGEFYSNKVVLACGRWITKLVPDLTKILTVYQQIVVYFQVDNMEKYGLKQFPPFSHRCSRGYFYCTPDVGNQGFKISRHVFVKPKSSIEDRVAEIYEQAKQYFGAGLKKIIKHEQCYYTATKSKDFIIDWLHPSENILICSCCSGHSFKMSPIIGRIVSDALVGNEELAELSSHGHQLKIPFHQGLNLE